MNTALPSRIIPLLLAACLGLVAVLSASAENWQTVTIAAPPARSAHGFILQRNGQTYGGVGVDVSDYGHWLIMNEPGTPPPIKLTLNLDVDLSDSLILFDTSAGDSATLPLVYGFYSNYQSGGGSGWVPSDIAESGFTVPPGSPPVRWFSVPAERRYHAFVLSQPGGVNFPLTVSDSVTTWQEGAALHSFTAYEGHATFDPSQPFRIADLSTDEQAPLFATDLVSITWTAGSGEVPMAPATIYLEGREDGHRFTVHSRAPGGPVIAQSVTAAGGAYAASPVQGGGIAYDTASQAIEVVAGSATLSFSVGRGMEFWITRDADGISSIGGAAGPMTAPAAAVYDGWLLYGVFPSAPQRSTEPRTFRIHGQRWGHEFTVWQSDGYHFRFGPDASENIQQYAFDTITNWDDQGLYNPLGIITFTAPIDPTRIWWLASNSASYPAIPALQADILDGWVPRHTAPPTYTGIDIRLPASLLSSAFRLSELNGETGGAEIGSSYDYRTVDTETMTGLDGMAPFQIQSFSLGFTDMSFAPQSQFLLQGGDASTPFSQTVVAGMNDLRLSFRPPQPLLLAVSSSRWDHELLIRHPEGTTFAVQKGQMQGDVSFDAQQNAWVTSYYYFDAMASANPELPWYLEDASTDERIGPNPSNADLINWFALADPKNLAGTENTDGTFSLMWNFAETSTEGAFQMERRESASEPWQLINTIPAADILDTHTHTARLAHAPWAVSQPGKTASLRVYYEYGGHRSAPSNEIVLNNFDSDGDGIPDAWELLWHLNPNDASDARARNPDTGETAAEMYDKGATPGAGGPPAGGDWKHRLSLWWVGSAYDANLQPLGPILTWDGDDIQPGTHVTIEREQAYGHWVTVREVLATDRYAVVATAEQEDPDYTVHAMTGEGRSFQDEPNFRLRSGYTSNESVRRIRLMMRSGSVLRGQPGIQEFDGEWFWESGTTPARKYYKHAEWSGGGDTGSPASHHRETSGNFDFHAEDNSETSSTEEKYDGTVVGTTAFGNKYPQPYPIGSNGASYADLVPDDFDESGTWTSPWHHTQIVVGPPFAEEWRFSPDWGSGMPSFEYGPQVSPIKRYENYPATSPGGPSFWRLLDLTEEYTVTDFFASTHQLLPVAPTTEGVSWYHGAGRGGAFVIASCQEWPPLVEGSRDHDDGVPRFGGTVTSLRQMSASLNQLDLSRSEWWLECNDCLPGQPVTVIEYEQDYGLAGISTPVGDKKIIRILSITPGSSPALKTKTPAAEIAHSDVTGSAVNRMRYIERLPVTLLVDANRDGTIDESDVTSKERPYRFWLNNDHDKGQSVDLDDTDHSSNEDRWEEDDILSSNKRQVEDFDRLDDVILWRRDLEDFTRLWITFKGITDMIKNGGVTVKLEWKPTTGETWTAADGNPAIRIFKAVGTDGGREYVEDENVASQQLDGIQGPGNHNNYSKALGTHNGLVMGGYVGQPQAVELPASFFTDLSESQPNKYLLFEGYGIGKGRLILTLHKSNQQIGEYPPLYMELKDVKDMYERYTCGHLQDPWNLPSTSPPMGWGANWPTATATKLKGPSKQNFVPSPDETKDYIVQVHGWNMSPGDKSAYGDTAFKRLWHLGFKGRFGYFQWPTFYFTEASTVNGVNAPPPSHYDASEYRAWKSAVALRALLDKLDSMESNKFHGKVRMVAHSMGNVVAGEALRLQGARIHSYVASQAAIAGSCYDPNAPPMAFRVTASPITPDVYSFYGPPTKNVDPSTWRSGNYPSYLSAGNLRGGATKYFNYYNAQDYALNWPRWQLDQQLKPEGFLGYNFDSHVDTFYQVTNPLLLQSRTLLFAGDTHEVFAFAAQPRCLALGFGVVNVPFGAGLNLQTIGYKGAHKWHSGQFRGTNMERGVYWRKLMENFGLVTPEAQ